MSAEAPITVVPENPNAHGGCVCATTEVRHGCEGPFAVVHGDQQFEYPYSPNVVVSAGCLRRLNEAMDDFKAREVASREANAPTRPHDLPKGEIRPNLTGDATFEKPVEVASREANAPAEPLYVDPEKLPAHAINEVPEI